MEMGFVPSRRASALRMERNVVAERPPGEAREHDRRHARPAQPSQGTSPIRPVWSRFPIVAMLIPCSRAFSIAISAARVATTCPKVECPSIRTHAAPLPHHLRLRLRVQLARLDSFQVLRDPYEPVRIVPGQVRLSQVVRHDRRVPRQRARQPPASPPRSSQSCPCSISASIRSYSWYESTSYSFPPRGKVRMGGSHLVAVTISCLS